MTKTKANKKLLDSVSGKPVLTIGFDYDITEIGGISYIPKEGKIRLPKISYQSLKKSKLTMNAWFLNSSIKKWGNSKDD